MNGCFQAVMFQVDDIYNDLNYVDSKEKKKNRREETKIDSEIEKKKR